MTSESDMLNVRRSIEGARPVGYLEIQKLVPPEGTPGRGAAIDRALKEAKDEANAGMPPGRAMDLYGSRLEQNGHNCILYIGLAPVQEQGVPRTPPPNPRNMNEAPQRVMGQIVDDPNVGFAEQRFGAGGQGLSQQGGAAPTPPHEGVLDIKSS